MASLDDLYSQWMSLPNDATRYAMLSQGGAGTSGLQQFIANKQYGGNMSGLNNWINNAGINGGYTANFVPGTGAYSYMNNGQRTMGNLSGYTAPAGSPTMPGGVAAPAPKESVWNPLDAQNPWLTGGRSNAPIVTPTVNAGGAITNNGGLGTGVITQQGTPMPKQPISALKPGYTGSFSRTAPPMTGIQQASAAVPVTPTAGTPITKPLRGVWK